MKSLLRYKVVLATFVMALLMTVMGTTAEAKTFTRKVTEDIEVQYIGDEIVFNGNDIKINGKKITKLKKKVKAINTGYTDNYDSYYKTGYYNDNSAYKAGKTYVDGYKYYGGKYYTFRFLKAGTYKFSKVDYDNYYGGNEVYKMAYKRSEVVNGVRNSYYTLQQISYSEENGYEYKDVGTEEYLYKTIDADKDTSYYTDYSYYQGVKSKKIYADGNYGITSATFKTGADAKKHLYYDAIVVKTTTVEQYKVVKESNIVTSVQLGKSKFTNKDARSAYSRTQTYTAKRFLSGNSGKLTVKMGSDYTLMDIVVVTYDKEGNSTYQLVKNKSKIAYGAYKSGSSYKDVSTTYAYSSTSMYKPTRVYVYYKNKTDKSYIDIKSITKDADGDYVIEYERGYSDGSKYTNKYYNSLPYGYSSYTFYKK